jgi:glycosyltransferase involved in cell wall biosynthesis
LAKVFVFASKVESQGMVVLESMACGTPVVAIGKMGTREVMGGDSGGFMVDDELETFAKMVEVLLNDSLIHKMKSDEALQHVSKWTIQLQAAKMIKLYNFLVKKHNQCSCIKQEMKKNNFLSKFYKIFFRSTG